MFPAITGQVRALSAGHGRPAQYAAELSKSGVKPNTVERSARILALAAVEDAEPDVLADQPSGRVVGFDLGQHAADPGPVVHRVDRKAGDRSPVARRQPFERVALMERSLCAAIGLGHGTEAELHVQKA